MITYVFTKSLQGDLFAKFHDVIVGWKNVDTLQRIPPSTKERVGNVVKVRSNQEKIDYNIETGGEIIEYRLEIEGDMTGYNVETKENGTKNDSTAWRQRKKGKEMHKSYTYIVCR